MDAAKNLSKVADTDMCRVGHSVLLFATCSIVRIYSSPFSVKYIALSGNG